MRIEYKTEKMQNIQPYEGNPRTHNDAQVKALCASIEKFGFLQPITIAPDGTIVAGHGRYLAARALALDEVPVIVARDLTEEELAAYRIVDNRLAEMGRWDFDMLKTELQLLQTDVDFSALGFDDATLGALLSGNKSDKLPPPEDAGPDSRNGRFILVYADEAEKDFWCKRCGIDGTKVVYEPADLQAKDN